MYCSWCASAVFWTACADASVSPRAHLFRAFKLLLGLSATAARDLVNDVHLWNLDSLLLHLQPRLDRCCRQRRSDRLLLRGSDVSEVRLVLTSRSALLTRCGSALFISSSLWCSSKLLGLLVVFVCLSRRARRSHWRTVRLCSACSLTCCAWSAGLTSHCSSRRRPALVANLSADASEILLFCFGLWVAIPPELLEQRSTLLLTCSHCCVGRVASWSLGTSRLRHACSDRPVSMSGGALRL